MTRAAAQTAKQDTAPVGRQRRASSDEPRAQGGINGLVQLFRADVDVHSRLAFLDALTPEPVGAVSCVSRRL